jgi:hypothetical protein
MPSLRFSLRTLLLVTALVAIALVSWLEYRQAYFCQIRWLTPGSAAANSLFPITEIRQLSDGTHRFTYYMRHRDVQSLMSSAVLKRGDFELQTTEQSIEMKSPDVEMLKKSLQALNAADKRKPGTFVIRGRVIDRNGKPVAGATVDLMGSFVLINYFDTRDDGTFTMPLYDAGGPTVPAGSGYYLCVRPTDRSEYPPPWNTTTFSLSPDNPELDIEIIMPRSFH